MKYPKSKKSAKLYASWLTTLHNKEYIAVEAFPKMKDKYAINFAAVIKDELKYYLVDGWKVVE